MIVGGPCWRGRQPGLRRPRCVRWRRPRGAVARGDPEASGLAAARDRARGGRSRSGQVLEAHQPDRTAAGSVAKIVTALWGLDALGPDYRFRTEMRGAGPVVDGMLHGDLVLAGGGDPLLDTDALGGMVRALRARGLRRSRGGSLSPTVRCRRWRSRSGQPADAAYNPAISGMNLNFNRVLLAWGPGADGPDDRVQCAGGPVRVPAAGVAAELVGAGLPRHRIEAARRSGRCARGGLDGRGSVWLPVRTPAAYAGAVFARPGGRRRARAAGGGGGGGRLGRAAGVRQGPPLTADAPGHARLLDQPDGRDVGLRAAQAHGPTRTGSRLGRGDAGWARAAVRAAADGVRRPFGAGRRLAGDGGRAGHGARPAVGSACPGSCASGRSSGPTAARWRSAGCGWWRRPGRSISSARWPAT